MSRAILSIVKSELKHRKIYMLWWSIGIAVLTAFIVLAYAAVKNQAGELNQAFSNISSTSSSFFGASNMFTPIGYLNSQLFYIVIPVLFIILTVSLAGRLTSKDEKNHTLELLLARPVSRTSLLVAKMTSSIIIVAILGAVAGVTALICSPIAGLHISSGYIALTMFWSVLFSGAFGAVAFALHTASQKTRKAAASTAILLSLGGYILSSIGGMVNNIDWLAKIFPYHYYDSGAILQGHVPAGLIIYVLALYGLSIVVSIIGFRRRDIS